MRTKAFDLDDDIEVRRVQRSGVLTIDPPPRAPKPDPDLPPLRQTRENRLGIYRVVLVRDGYVPFERMHTMTPELAGEIVRQYLADVDREHCVVILLDTKLHPIGLNTVSVGSLNASVVQPREVFKPAILGNAHAIIVAHNHPSGAVEPSLEDRQLFIRLEEAGRILGIQVLDQIIVGDGTHAVYSAKEHRQL